MSIGDPVEVCRPVHDQRGFVIDLWFPATVAAIDADTITVVYADFERQAFSRRQSAYVVRAITPKEDTNAGK